MNLPRINELANRINSLRKTLRKLNSRIHDIEQEIINSRNAQDALDAAVRTAKFRIEKLGALGVSTRFLEDLAQPLLQRPDFSSVGSALKREIRNTESQIQATNSQINAADREKTQLEMEAPCN